MCIREDEQRFHERLLNSLLRAQAQSELLKPEQMNMAIIGAGATGTELAAELRSATRQLVAYAYDRIDPEKDTTINLIEATDRILPALPKRLADEDLYRRYFESTSVAKRAKNRAKSCT